MTYLYVNKGIHDYIKLNMNDQFMIVQTKFDLI